MLSVEMRSLFRVTLVIVLQRNHDGLSNNLIMEKLHIIYKEFGGKSCRSCIIRHYLEWERSSKNGIIGGRGFEITLRQKNVPVELEKVFIPVFNERINKLVGRKGDAVMDMLGLR